MNRRLFAISLLPVLLFSQVSFPCADNYVHPVFSYQHAPENPYENFAAGRIGIVKPTYRRVVLYAAYRYLNGGGFSSAEQQTLVSIWNAEFRNEEPDSTLKLETIRRWLSLRGEIAKDFPVSPTIATDRRWGADDFNAFPNCSLNAFETAVETLSNRIMQYGGDDPFVLEWVRAQDLVFSNCSGGRNIPLAVGDAAPVWLRKDRDYQIAAAYFYATDFEEAQQRFDAISNDSDSPWRETCDYLVARTLVRRAHFTKDPEQQSGFYFSAEKRLARLSGGGFFADGARLLNLIKLRQRPAERLAELEQNLHQFGGDDFRQDLIDYTWLLDKFETQILAAEEKRKSEEEAAKFAESDKDLRDRIVANLIAAGGKTQVIVEKGRAMIQGWVPLGKLPEALRLAQLAKPNKIDNQLIELAEDDPFGQLSIESFLKSPVARPTYEPVRNTALFSESTLRVWVPNFLKRTDAFLLVPPSTPDTQIIEMIQSQQDGLTDDNLQEIRDAIREARADQIRKAWSSRPQRDYEGGYSGEERISFGLLPEFLLSGELTDWLFSMQAGESAYRHSLGRWRDTNSKAWLVAALTNSTSDSAEIDELIRAAQKLAPNDAAFPTCAYHSARILIAKRQSARAARILDELMVNTNDLPVSSRNEIARLRFTICDDLSSFLKSALRKPFTFLDYAESTTINEVIAKQKAWWSPESSQSKSEWDAYTESLYAEHKRWEDRLMFDVDSTTIINERFPISLLLEAQESPELPVYLRERLAIVIWTRAVLLKNDAVLRRIAPQLLETAPEVRDYLSAPNTVERRIASLFVIYRHPNFLPYLQSGFDTPHFSYQTPAGWWCEPDYSEYISTGESVRIRIPSGPPFLSRSQIAAAAAESAALKAIGSAPGFLAETAIELQRLRPDDSRIPEMLLIASNANVSFIGNCNSFAGREKAIELLKRRYPKWAKKIDNQ